MTKWLEFGHTEKLVVNADLICGYKPYFTLQDNEDGTEILLSGCGQSVWAPEPFAEVDAKIREATTQRSHLPKLVDGDTFDYSPPPAGTAEAAEEYADAKLGIGKDK